MKGRTDRPDHPLQTRYRGNLYSARLPVANYYAEGRVAVVKSTDLCQRCERGKLCKRGRGLYLLLFLAIRKDQWHYRLVCAYTKARESENKSSCIHMHSIRRWDTLGIAHDGVDGYRSSSTTSERPRNSNNNNKIDTSLKTRSRIMSYGVISKPDILTAAG